MTAVAEHRTSYEIRVSTTTTIVHSNPWGQPVTMATTRRRKNEGERYNSKLTLFEEEICRFDSILERIQKVFSEDLKVYDRVVEVRDALFRLQQQMRGLQIVEFACSGLDDVVYQNTLNDMFWDKAKQHRYDAEEDEGLKGEEDES
jgi:hypothetical protein